MIVCPNCNHQNPEAALACEACYTPLSTISSCPHCGATIELDATFCGQCGLNLPPEMTENAEPLRETMVNTSNLPGSVENPNPDPVVTPVIQSIENSELVMSKPESEEKTAPSSKQPGANPSPAQTMLQIQRAQLVHLQSNTTIEIPSNLPIIHIGKPNEHIPPDIDVAGFPNSEIVSRVHADIRLEGDTFFIEDLGSSNGTYINHNYLSPGNRHRLRAGDRIALGKEDKVTFIFELS